ncbi:MAG: hypothetical protein GXY64_02325 [Bacteroidales bacterium]|nr:hypothetical protein [Bacteroidales bacterium]
MNIFFSKLALVLTVLSCAFLCCEKAEATENLTTTSVLKSKTTRMKPTASTLQKLAGTWSVYALGEKNEELKPNSWADMYCSISDNTLQVYTFIQTYDPKDKTSATVREEIDSYPINWTNKNQFNIDGTDANIYKDAEGRVLIECGSFRMLMQQR